MFSETYVVRGSRLQVVQVQPTQAQRYQAKVLSLTALSASLLLAATLGGKALVLLTAGSPVLAGVVLALVLPTLAMGNALSRAFVPQVRVQASKPTQTATTSKPQTQKSKR